MKDLQAFLFCSKLIFFANVVALYNIQLSVYTKTVFNFFLISF